MADRWNFGPDLIPPELTRFPGNLAVGYVLQLVTPAAATAVVWSYDRRGVRCDASYYTGALKTVAVETSTDGTTWTPPGQAAWNRSVYGQAVPLDKPVAAKFFRLVFRDQDGKPVPMSVDELEVY